MKLWLNIATALEYGILVLLFVLSIWSIGIILDRRRVLRRESRDGELEELRALLVKGDNTAIKRWIDSHPGIHASALVAMQAAGVPNSGDAARIDRSVRAYLTQERLRIEKGFAVLATLGANAPFIGLFGTVLGIIRAFAALGESSGAASSVMSGISQALVATAAGLFVAIPAVVAFNAFANRLKTLISQCESLKDLYVANQPSNLPANQPASLRG